MDPQAEGFVPKGFVPKGYATGKYASHSAPKRWGWMPIENHKLDKVVSFTRTAVQEQLLLPWDKVLLESHMETRACFRSAGLDWSVSHWEPFRNEGGLDPLVSVLHSLPIGVKDTPPSSEMSFQNRRTVDFRHNSGFLPNLRIIAKQDKQYRSGKGDTLLATNAWLEAVFNPFDGVIVLVASKTPAEMLQEFKMSQEPPAQTGHTPFSEILINIWDKIHSWDDDGTGLSKGWLVGTTGYMKLNSPGMRWWLNYISIVNIRHNPDIIVLQRCLHLTGCPSGQFPVWNYEETTLFQPAIRKTFEIGSWPYYGLLSMQCCQDIVWALIRGKPNFGHKVIKSITIFQPMQRHPRDATSSAERQQWDQEGHGGKGYHDMTEWPAVLLEIVPFDEKYVKLSDAYLEPGLKDWRAPLRNESGGPIKIVQSFSERSPGSWELGGDF